MMEGWVSSGATGRESWAEMEEWGVGQPGGRGPGGRRWKGRQGVKIEV